MRIPANALSRALVGCLAACAYALHQRSLLRAERRALGELNEELLCEARLHNQASAMRRRRSVRRVGSSPVPYVVPLRARECCCELVSVVARLWLASAERGTVVGSRSPPLRFGHSKTPRKASSQQHGRGGGTRAVKRG